MKSRTSFFKPVTLKKDLLRFAPVWALYLVGMLLVLTANSYSSDDRYANYVLPSLVKGFGVVNLCYSALVAVLLFGDLYNTKLCYSLHAMPYRRESWMLTHVLAGLLFSLVPNCVATLYLMYRLQSFWFLGLYWLLAATLQFLFCYGVAAVSAMLTGSRFAMLAVCAGFHFVAMLLYATADLLYAPMLTGVVVNVEDFSVFSPVVNCFRYDYFIFSRIQKSNYNYMDTLFRYEGLGGGWGYSAILAVVGILLLGVALWLYRKRQLETAGDFVAFPKLKGIACVIITLCVTLCFALLGKVFDMFLLWISAGLTIGFFGSLMLLERRLKVFRKKTFLGFGAMVVVVALSVLCVSLDLFGIESWTPDADRVASVTVSNQGRYGVYVDDLEVTLTDPEDIDQIIQAHADILDRLDEPVVHGHRVYLTYTMKSGRKVERYYYAPASGENYEIIRKYLYELGNVLGYSDPAEAAKKVEYMYTNDGMVQPEFYEKMLAAMLEDGIQGHILPDNKAGEYFVEYEMMRSDGAIVRRYVVFSSGAENVAAVLDSTEFRMGYGDWDTFLQQVQEVEIYGVNSSEQVPEAKWESLLTCLRKDLENGHIPEYAPNSAMISYVVPTPHSGNQVYTFYITARAEYVQAWIKDNENPAGW